MPPLPTTSDLLRLYGIKAKKKLSQNFILDPRILQRFVKIGGKIENEYAIEVGPGPGGITRAILDAQVKEVHVIEKDPRFIPTLKLIQESVGPERLFINIGDCLHFNASKRFEGKVSKTKWDSPDRVPLTLYGNLPFNVATPFLIKNIKNMSEQSDIYSFGRVTAILCFQHEVALRMCAPPNTPERCRLSVICQNWADVHYKHMLPGGAFTPPPEVDVGIVRLNPLRQPYIDLPFNLVNDVVNALFVGSKNKQIKNGLIRLFRPYQGPHYLTQKLIKMCDINPNSSAVQLSMDEIRDLCFGFKQMQETEQLIQTQKDSMENISEAVNEDILSVVQDNFNEHSSEIPTDDNTNSNNNSDPKYVVRF